MGLTKFSYCLQSRKFDDTPVTSNLVLDTGSGSGDKKTPGVSYTPFYKNPLGKVYAASREFYYVTLRRITVGNKRVKIPYKYLRPGPDGNGGTIVDSGSTFTYMERPVFESVVEEFTKQMRNYSRVGEVEKLTGLEPCFKVSGHKLVSVPEFELQFKGGAKLRMPLENYIVSVNKDVICLTVVSNDRTVGPQVSVGPAIILGSFQVQNFYLEFDLANERFGFAERKCT